MIKQTVDILAACKKPVNRVVMGNVAIARGAIESGVGGVFSYPGTPSTEISEVFRFVHTFQHDSENENLYPELVKHKIYFEYSINEKIALEKAIAFSIGNRSALCVMKNVGMNVASDALMSIAYQTIIAPLIIVLCDDPGCHSSSNEQDSRYWGPMANIPVFNPSNPAEAKEMVKQAFKLSGELKLPVIVRTSTRVSHSRSVVEYGKKELLKTEVHFDRLPEHINIPARTAAAHQKLIEKLQQKNVLDLHAKNSRYIFRATDKKFGIITSGVSSEYVSEILYHQKLTKKITVLNLGLIHPFPVKEVLKFLNAGYKKILVLEELDPIIENQIRIIAQQNKIHTSIFGKGFSLLKPSGEFSLDMLNTVIQEFTKIKFTVTRKKLPSSAVSFLQQLPPRPPALCAGCPHRSTFYLLKLAIPREQSELILCGDIGCFGLGALPPLKMVDTINHMGMSISMAQGLNEAFRSVNNNKKLVALLGDGTFFHSGLASLVNAVYTRANILVVIFDNRTIGMTGHQSHPGASQRLSKYHEIEIAPMLQGIGIEVVETINPFDLRDSIDKLKKAMDHSGVSVVVAKSPCIFLPDFKEKINRKRIIKVDESKCNSCANHSDMSLHCSRCYSSLNNLSRARQKLFAPEPIEGNQQLCPANICNHGFFNSVIEGNYKAAVDMVRDKMLFARTCGDICHRPCELFSGRKNPVPIKALKHFVSSYENYFEDFSEVKKRIKQAHRKNKKIAVIGAGPAGLSAAYDLIQEGYDVDVFEKEKTAGGMVTYSIPSFRMDKTGFEFESMKLQELGVVFHFNKALGKDYSLKEMAGNFDGVILAIGMGVSKKLNWTEKIEEKFKTDALSFLKNYNTNNLNGESGIVEGTVLIIGGGNSAMDASRTAKKIYPDHRIVVSCPESKINMPAFAEEIKHAEAEGVEIIDDSIVHNYEMNGVVNVTLYRHSENELMGELKCSKIIYAIGQASDKMALSELNSGNYDDSGRVTELKSAGFNNVFIAGDLHSGNSMSVIGAIASGKKAAVDVRKLLENYSYDYEGEFALNRLNNTSVAELREVANDLTDENHFENKNELKELVKFDLFQSCAKCNHCIDNFGCPAMVKVNGKVQIDLSRCTLCGLCIDVCPNNAISWVEVNE